ncbi:MAG: DUF4129 domain-containing protein [Steroidobacteraceae bacterium]|jgi:hypothetical protein
MPSESIALALRARFLAAIAAALLAVPTAAPHADAPAASSAAPAEGPVRHEEIQQAVAKLAGDENLGGEQKWRVLRWRSQAPPANTPSWAGGLFGFLAQSIGFLSWTAGGAVAAFAALGLVRWLRALPSVVESSAGAHAQSVGRLDLDPASFPKDIGAAALALLENLRTREAVSLLYRGALARAVHRHGVVIGESYTESEALRAMNAQLDPARAAYLADLVDVWQRTVYAGETGAREAIERLCYGFAPALDEAAP